MSNNINYSIYTTITFIFNHVVKHTEVFSKPATVFCNNCVNLKMFFVATEVDILSPSSNFGGITFISFFLQDKQAVDTLKSK